MHTAIITFGESNSNSRRYAYKVPTDWEVEVGDVLVVKSPNEGYSCGIVREVQPRITDLARVRAVCKVDVQEHMEYLRMEEFRSELLSRITARVNDLVNDLPLTVLSAQDNQLANLVEQLRSMDT